MYVVPFSHGPARLAHRPHRRAAHRLGLRRREHADHDPHGPGRPRRARRRRRVRPVPALGRLPAATPTAPRPTCRGRATPRTSTSSTSPRPARSGRYGSGYGGNALLGKKCFALRIASTMARDDGWMAEHMLILGITPPERREEATSPPRSRRPAARPTWPCSSRRCPGWKVETVGDDIAWMKFGDDGRLYAINPEAGFFGVAPGTVATKTNPNAMRTARRQLASSPTCAKTDDGDVWWEGMTDEPPAHLIDWKGNDWTPESGTPGRPPQRPLHRPGRAVPVDRPRVGGPGRRADLGHPLRRPPRHQRPARDRGVRLAARRVPRLDHVARRRPPPRPAPSASCASTRSRCCPFCGYNMGDYFDHWLEIGEATDADKLPEAVLGQLVPQGRRRQVPVAGLRREQPGAQVGRRAGRRRRRRRSTRRSAACPTADGHRHRPGLDIDDATLAQLLDGRRRGVARPRCR